MQSPNPRRFERASRFWLAAFQNLYIDVEIKIDDVLGGDLQNELATRQVLCQIGLPKEWIYLLHTHLLSQIRNLEVFEPNLKCGAHADYFNSNAGRS